MRVKNRVNIVCFRTKHVMMIVEDVDQIMKKQLKHRLHFENVFDHVKLLKASITVIKTKRNFCLSLSLSRADVVDQFLESIIDISESIINFEINITIIENKIIDITLESTNFAIENINMNLKKNLSNEFSRSWTKDWNQSNTAFVDEKW
jgi:hypothetical protein